MAAATKKTVRRNGNGSKKTPVDVSDPTNGAEFVVAMSEPYIVNVTIEGTAALLFHRWNVEAVEEKANAAKGSKAKKTDDVESYVYRNEEQEICLPAEYVRMSIVMAAKYKQDPRSPRKQAKDLYNAAIVPLDELASLGTTTWDYLDRRRVTVQRAGITRTRPAFQAGWRANLRFQVILPEYVPPMEFLDTLNKAGKFEGVGDFRPTYGRFAVVKFEVETE